MFKNFQTKIRSENYRKNRLTQQQMSQPNEDSDNPNDADAILNSICGDENAEIDRQSTSTTTSSKTNENLKVIGGKVTKTKVVMNKTLKTRKSSRTVKK